MPSTRSSSPADLIGLLAAALQRLPAASAAAPAGRRGYAVAYSGGRDSTALLHAAVGAGLSPLRALHVHHGLMPQADAWAHHCRQTAEALGLPLLVLKTEVQPAGDGIEAAARRARYRALAAALGPGEVLMMAHHADDQAETVLHRLLRGAGIDGLAGMPASRALGPGLLWRPFLELPRDAIEAWLAERALTWIDDPGNADGSNLRARLRPLLDSLEGLVPGGRRALSRLAGQAAAEAQLRDRLLAPELEARLDDGRLRSAGLLERDATHRHALLRLWCRRLGLRAPGRDWLRHCDRDVLGAAPDRQPSLELGGCRLRRFGGWLWLLPPLAAVPEGWSAPWRGGSLRLPGDAGSLIACATLPADCRVRFPRPGERFRLASASGSRPAKVIFQEHGIPPWERRRTPVVEVAGQPRQLGRFPLAGAADGWPQEAIRWLKPAWHLGAASSAED